MAAMYQVDIKETSRELSKVDRIKLKDFGNATKFDDIVSTEQSAIIVPEAYAVVTIHNPKAEGGQYDAIIVTTAEGEKFMTGSKTFIERFLDIWHEMRDDGTSDEFSVEVYKRESNNYKGKYFLGCSLA